MSRGRYGCTEVQNPLFSPTGNRIQYERLEPAARNLPYLLFRDQVQCTRDSNINARNSEASVQQNLHDVGRVCPKPQAIMLNSVIPHGASSGCEWKRGYCEHIEYGVVNSQQEAVLLFGLGGPVTRRHRVFRITQTEVSENMLWSKRKEVKGWRKLRNEFLVKVKVKCILYRH